MKNLVAGHTYELSNFENKDEKGQVLQFIHKEPIEEGSTELKTISDGTTNENKADWGELKTAEVDFKVNVNPVADDATIKVGQPEGFEDAGRINGNKSKDPAIASKITNPENGIKLPIEVTSTDKDGSETFTVTIKDIPNGGAIFVKDPVTKQDILVAYDKNGIPVVTYNTGGSPEAITPETGIVTNNKDAYSILEAINEIEKERSKGNFSKEVIRNYAIKNFNKQKQFKQYIDLYKKLLE